MTTRNPWLGLASYDVPKGMEEDYLFCGRDEETMDIVRLIDNNLFVTLYGSSGIGKTSLLKAGVIPILKRKDYFPLYVRLSQESNEISYAEAIVRHLKNCGLTEESHVALEHADGNDRLFLWNYFATTRFLDADGREIYPVIILDQFEEVFRDADKAKAELLLQQIYLLLNDELEMPDAEGYSADTNYRFVASIREDYLFVLEDSIDELSLDLYKNNRYRLRPMKPENARQVVLVPGRDCIEESEKEKVTERVLELAKKPQSDDIDTLLLSLVCAGTFDKKTGEKITFSNLSIWKDNPMQIYYQDAMRVLNANQIRYIQQHLIREDGSRKRIDSKEVKIALGENTYQLLTQGKNRLFALGDKGQVELLHDKLAMAVYEERKAFEERERKMKLARRVSIIGVFGLAVLGVFFFQNHRIKQQQWKMLENQSRLVAKEVISNAKDDSYSARMVALEILPKDLNNPIDMPYTPEAERALREACKFNSAVIKSQKDWIDAVFSPDEKQIMATTYDSSLVFLDTKSGETIRTIKMNQMRYMNSYSPNGDQILTCFDNTVIVLDAQTGKEAFTIEVDTSHVNSAKYNPNGKRIITTSGHSIKIWDATTGEVMKTIESNEWFLYATFSPDGNQIAAFQRDEKLLGWTNENHTNTILVYEATTYNEKHAITITDQLEPEICFSPNGKRILLSSYRDEIIRVLDIDSKSFVAKIHTNHCNNVRFSPDGKYIMSSPFWGIGLSTRDSYNTIKIWDANTSEEVKTLYGHKGCILSAEFSPDGTKVISTSSDYTLRIWDLNSTKESTVIVKNDSRIFNASIHPLSQQIAAVCEGNTVKVWDMVSGKETINLKHNLKHDDYIGNISFIPDGEKIIYNYKIDTIQHFDIYDIREKIVTKTFPLLTKNVTRIMCSPDGEKIVFVDAFDGITLYDVETGSLVWSVDKNSILFSASYSPDGKRIVVATNPICVLDSNTGLEVLACSTGQSNGFVLDAKYSPDGKTIVSTGDDNALNILDAQTGCCLKILEGHLNGILCACFSPDGKYIASGSKDKTIRVWDAQTGVCISVLRGHDAPVTTISFSLDGRSIISVSDDFNSEDHTIRKWDFPPLQELIDQTRERFKDRPLTDEERRLYYLE